MTRPGPGLERRIGPESGATLVEVLVAVVIMGIAFVIIVGGIATAIIGSEKQRQQAGAEVVLRTAAESLDYTPCATTYTPGPVTGFVVSVTGVSHWNPATNAFDSTCAADTGLQLVELSAVSTTGRGASPETLRVVKRRP